MRGWLWMVAALAGALAGCGSDEDGDGKGGSAGTAGTSGSGGAGAGAGSAGAAGSAGVSIDDLGKPCVDGACPAGITPVTYCGFAGCPPDLCSCEIPCDKDPNVCPAGTQCVTVSDGPGEVCSK